MSRRWDAVWFGEGQSRIIISLPLEQWLRLEEMAASCDVPILRLGDTGGTRLTCSPTLDLLVSEIEDVWRNGLDRALGA